MEKPKLTETEFELYTKIMQIGSLDDMFDFAYRIGRARLSEELLKSINKD